MTERRPLVQIAGEVQELPSGDSLPGGGGGTSNRWLTGTGNPDGVVTATASGDLYLDTATGDIYQASAANANSWASPITNIKGAAGANGTGINSGAGAPSGGVGAEGDFYIDTTAVAIYGPKITGVWGSPTSLIGDDGPSGNVWFVQELVDATALTTGDLLLQSSSGNVYRASAPGAGNWGSPVMNLMGPQGEEGEAGTTTFDAILDAVAEGAINNGTYGQVWNWASGVSQALALQVNSNTLFNVGYDGASFETYAGLHAQHVFIATSGGKLSFFSEAGATRQMVSAASTGVGDGAIAALTFSSSPTQAECEALRDHCEYLRDWIEEVRTRLNELNFALDAYGLIENGI